MTKYEGILTFKPQSGPVSIDRPSLTGREDEAAIDLAVLLRQYEGWTIRIELERNDQILPSPTYTPPRKGSY